MTTLEDPRRQLIQELRTEGIRNERVLAAISRVPREAFLPPDLMSRANENVSLPIGLGQTISQPYVVALMTEALQVAPTDRVLELGTGSGYQAAVLAELVASVTTVERVPELRESATRLLASLGYGNIEVHQAGATLGWPGDGPYDRIIVTAGGPEIPSALVQQLRVGGRLVMPVGTLAGQQLVLVTRTADGTDVADLGRVRFVPLIGAGAWPDGAPESLPDADGLSEP